MKMNETDEQLIKGLSTEQVIRTESRIVLDETLKMINLQRAAELLILYCFEKHDDDLTMAWRENLNNVEQAVVKKWDRSKDLIRAYQFCDATEKFLDKLNEIDRSFDEAEKQHDDIK